jgi:5'-nucleotidase
MKPGHPQTFRVHRPLDLAAVDAVGFDLDHTLALYDDAAVNRIAADATRHMLVRELGYPESILLTHRDMESPSAARTLAADLVRGAVVKLGADRRVLHARHAGRWLDPAEIDRDFGTALDDSPADLYTVYSPFELPVLWLLEELESVSPPRGHRGARCEDVRHMLDAAHTHGLLKSRLRADLPRFVGPGTGDATALGRWVAAGKRLFVVTNSETDFAPAVLERALGAGWVDLFEVVVTNARKPAFFRPSPMDQAATALRRTDHPLVMEGGSAAALEGMLGLRSNQVLFVGDNVRSDIRAARDHGWRTAHIAPEIGATTATDGWGDPLSHGGRPTRLAHMLREADIACDGVGALLSIDPSARLQPPPGGPAGGESP